MTMTNYKHTDGPLRILFSCRLRLDDKQREVLKQAHNEFRQRATVASKSPVMAGSSLTVETTTNHDHADYQKFGFSSLVVNNLIVSRESIPLAILLKLEEMLGVKVIDRKQLQTSFENYLNYLEVK